MKFRRVRRPDPTINLTALIDILFIVLVFLVLTTTFREARQFRIDLPRTATGERVPVDAEGRIRVTVAQDGRLYLGQQVVSLGELRDVFESALVTPDAQVLLEADERAEHGRVVEVMDLAREVGLSRLSIETTRAVRPPP